jgi:hypothetical protein
MKAPRDIFRCRAKERRRRQERQLRAAGKAPTKTESKGISLAMIDLICRVMGI